MPIAIDKRDPGLNIFIFYFFNLNDQLTMTMSKVSDHKDKASLSPQSSLSFAHPVIQGWKLGYIA